MAIDRELRVGTPVELMVDDPPGKRGARGTIERVTDSGFYVRIEGVRSPESYDLRGWGKDVRATAGGESAIASARRIFEREPGKAFDLLARAAEELAARVRELEKDTAR